MTDQDKQRFEKTFSRLHLHFPEVGSNGTHLQRLCSSYFSALADVEIENIEAAAITHINTGEFFPNVSEIRRIIGETSSNTNDSSTALQPAEQTAAAIAAIGGKVLSIKAHPIRITDRDEVDLAMNVIPAGDYLAVEVRALVPVATKDQP